MSEHDDLLALADLNGILPSYYDLHGNQRLTTPETQKALLTANGIDVSNAGAIANSLASMRHDAEDRWFPEEIIIECGVVAPLDFGLGAEWQLRLDESEVVVAEGQPSDHITLPALSAGIYVLTATASGRTEIVTVLAAPKRLPSVDDLTGSAKHWGLNLALYGLRSDRNAGLGDFADLADVARIAGGKGAAFLGINPLHNMGFCNLAAISPYSPSHRGFLNTAYIALDQIPGIKDAPDLAEFSDLKSSETVQYQEHKVKHNQKLEVLFDRFIKSSEKNSKAAFTCFKTDAGEQLVEFARFESLGEIHGADWRIWPDVLGDVANERLEFHMWLQWVASVQLASAQAAAKAAGMSLGLYLDLAVGSRRDGAESWCERSAVAEGVSIGAPPDHLSPAGQNWDLTAFAPRKLQAQRYRPMRRILAQIFDHAGIIRIDHVLGLNRSFWIPDNGSPGGYIRQPFDSLLAVIKIEAARHNCAVVGEDLGLVPDGFRDTMRSHGFYGYAVVQYEKEHDGAFRDQTQISAQVLSCFATHDTPTVKGYAIGCDIDWWQKLGWIDTPTAENMRQERTNEVAKFYPDQDFQTSIHALLAHSNAALVAVQLDDLLGNAEAQNLPGTIDEHPNWRRKYETSMGALAQHATLSATSAMMNQTGRTNEQRSDR